MGEKITDYDKAYLQGKIDERNDIRRKAVAAKKSKETQQFQFSKDDEDVVRLVKANYERAKRNKKNGDVRLPDVVPGVAGDDNSRCCGHCKASTLDVVLYIIAIIAMVVEGIAALCHAEYFTAMYASKLCILLLIGRCARWKK